MFPKPFRIKSNSAIKGSVKKQLKREVSFKYPSLSAEDLNDILPPKSSIHCVQYESFRDSNVSLFYMLNDNPILFTCGTNLYPSVYTLWKHPNMLRTVTTSAFVIKKLSEGADLMLPGVLVEDRAGFSLDGIIEGQPLAVNMAGNRSAVAVGISLMSHSQMIANQMKGKLVEILHIYGDHLWLAGTKQELPVISYSMETRPTVSSCNEEESVPQNNDNHDQCELVESVPTATLHEGEEGLESSGEIVRPKPSEEHLTSEQEDSDTENLEAALVESEPEVDMDELLSECLLKALKSLVKLSHLPLLTSTLYGSLMTQICPPDLKLDIKKSSYKKVSQFLRKMAEKGVMEMSSEGGSDVITSVNRDHPLLEEFQPLLTKGVKPKTVEAENSKKKGITVEEMWSPTQRLVPILSPHGVSKSSRVTSSQVRAMVTQYVKENDLTNKDNPQLVDLDPILSAALQVKVDTCTIPWKQLFSLVFEQMRATYIIHQGSSETVVKHTLPKVKLTVCRRANKTVTLVDNLDMYGIPASDVAHRIQRMAACHSAVHATPGGSQVLIQGNQVKSTVKILEDVYGLPLKFIEAQDNIKPPKKKGRKK